MFENSDDERDIDPKALQTAEQNTIVKELTQRSHEKWEVAQLLNDPEPVSKPIPFIKKINENRKQQHEVLLAKLADDLNGINIEIENNIRLASEEVKAQMWSYKEKLDEILSGMNIPEVAYYCRPVFLNIQLQAEEMKNKQLKLIEELYQDLIEFETVRRKKNEKIFHSGCEEIRRNGFMTPYDLECFVEQEILKMDQLVLNNRRCYEDLRLKLTLITVESFKSFVDKMSCVKEKWVRHELEEAQQKTMMEVEEKVEEDPKPITRLELKGEELIIDLTPNGLYNTCEVKHWLANVNSIVNTIEKHQKNLIEMYKKVLDAVFFNFDSKVEIIRKELNEMEIIEFEERILQPILFQAQNEQNGDIEKLEVYWQESLNEIRVTITDVLDFLFAIGKLWDRHEGRISESEEKTITAWEKVVEENNTVLQDLENKFNKTCDNLRQEYEKLKVKKLYLDAIQILDDIKLKYEENYRAEVNIIEEFYTLMKEEANVFSSEIKEFVDKLQPLEGSTSAKRDSIDNHNFFGNKFIHTQIKMCLDRVKKIPSWKQGIWKALDGHSQKITESLEKRSEPWVTSKIQEITEKMQTQLEKHSRRYDRIRTKIYNVRMKEIQDHSLTIEHYKTEVERKCRRIKLDLKILIEKQDEGLNELEKYCYETEEKLRTEQRSGVICCLQIQAERRKSQYEKKIANAYAAFLRECETRLGSVGESNADLMESMKLFSEGGNFHPEELKLFKEDLEMIEKNLPGEFQLVEKELKESQNVITNKLNEVFDPVLKMIMWTCEELQFNDAVLTELSRYTKIIQDLALHIKSDFNHLRNQCEKLFDSLNDPDHIFAKRDCWFGIIRALYKNISNIFYPVILPQEFEEVLEESACSDDLGFSTRATISDTDTLLSFGKDKEFICKDYKPELFKSKAPPDNDFTFMAIISNKLWGYMDNLQRLACIFYKKLNCRKLVRDDLVLGSYDLFAKSMIVKLQYYNVQCEQLWLSIMQEFLPILTRLKDNFNKYVERRIWDVERKTINEIINHHQEFMSNINEFMNETNYELKKLDDRLLTLHGHPSNEILLNELENNVVFVTARLEANWDSLISAHKNELISLVNQYVKNDTEMKEIEDHCMQIKNAMFIDDFGFKLLNTIMKYTERGGYFIKRHSKNLNQPRAPPSTPTEVISEVPSSYDLNLLPLGAQTQTVQMHLLELEELLYSESDAKLNIVVQAINCEELIKISLKTIEDFIKELFWIADSQKNILEEKIFKWLEIWKCNVVKVQKLYAVKYSGKAGELKP